MPAYNEEGRIISTLVAINAFIGSQPDATEVIVADDGSTDSTSDIVGNFARSHPYVR